MLSFLSRIITSPDEITVLLAAGGRPARTPAGAALWAPKNTPVDRVRNHSRYIPRLGESLPINWANYDFVTLTSEACSGDSLALLPATETKNYNG